MQSSSRGSIANDNSLLREHLAPRLGFLQIECVVMNYDSIEILRALCADISLTQIEQYVIRIAIKRIAVAASPPLVESNDIVTQKWKPGCLPGARNSPGPQSFGISADGARAWLPAKGAEHAVARHQTGFR